MESLWTLPEALGLLALLLNLALLYQFHPKCGGKREKKGVSHSQLCVSCSALHFCPIKPY